MNKAIYLTISVLLLFNTAVFGMERFDIVTTKKMKQMLEDKAAGKTDFVLANTLDEIIFRHSSIPGSVSLPWSKVDKVAHRLGNDKDKLIITY